MNGSIFRLIFSKRLHSLVPVAEFVTSNGKSSNETVSTSSASWVSRLRGRLRQAHKVWALPQVRGVAIALAVSLGTVSPASFAQVPTGGVVQTGAGTISGDNKNLLIQQASQKLGIDWQSYNIGAGNRVRYEQPNAQAIALNRVIGNNRSEIYGAIDANGQVFLINPNGILFGRTAEVNVGGLFASTRDISQADFAAGKYNFSGTGDASVINQGQLKALEGGSIVLAGREVRNEGSITANKGRVVLAAGETIDLTMDSDNKLVVKVDATAANALVDNSGLITANNGQVFLTAKGRGMALDNAINMGGLIQAHGGTVVADGGDSGVVQVNGGTIDVSGATTPFADASSSPQEGNGGTVILSGQYVGVLNGATINASGAAGGGKVIVGGDQLNKVTDLMPVRLADRTIFDSSSKIDISSSDGDGGFVETSGQAVNIEGAILGTSKGKAGEWLIDPNNLIVTNSTTLTPTATQTGSAFTCSSASGSYVRDSAISAATADVTLTTTGDIYSDSNVLVSTTKNVTLTAANVGVAGSWTANNLIFNQSKIGGIVGAITANVVVKAGDLRYYSVGNIDVTKTISVENGATFSIYTDTTLTRTVDNDFNLNGGTIKIGGVNDNLAANGNFIRSNGMYMVHIFTAGGNFDTSAWSAGKSVDYLIVGGGGAGGSGQATNYWYAGGGGGAGSMKTGTATINAGTNNVVVGAGGGSVTGNTDGNNGGASSFSGITAQGGGGGGGYNRVGKSGGNGGGGGGPSSSNSNRAGGTSTDGGNAGGRGLSQTYSQSGGGGGAGSSPNGAGWGNERNGGAGLVSEITGASVTYSAGGSGAPATTTKINGVSAAANTGGGGGGGAVGGTSGAGGSGIVVARYAIANADSATTVTLNGAVTLGSGKTSTLNAATDNSVIKVQGAISGGGHIAINSTAPTPTSTRVEFSNNANTYTGNTSVISGELRAGIAQAFGAAGASNVSINAGALLNLSGFNQNVGSLSGGGNITTNATNAILTTGGANINSTFSGLILNSADGGVLSLVKEGTGNQILTGANTYTGTTTVSGGTLQVGNGTAGSIAGTSAITNNANLIFNRSAATTALDFNADLGSTVSGSGSTTIIVGSGINIDADIAQGNITVNGKAGDVNINNVVCATGMTFINTTNGNINVNANVEGFNVTLKAGEGTAAGTVANGNVAYTSGAIKVNSAGILTVFSGDVADLVALDNAVTGAESAGGAYRIATFNTAVQSHSTAGMRNYDLRTNASGVVTEVTASKTYDGNSNAAGVLNLTGITLNYSRGLTATGSNNVSITVNQANFIDNSGAETSRVANASGLNVSFNQDASTTMNVSGKQWTVKGADIANYSNTTNANISKASLTIAVKDASVTQGSTYTPEYTYTGLQGGETAAGLGISPTLSGTTSTAVAGTYTLTPAGADSLDNYAVTYQGGTLVVKALQNTNALSGEAANMLAEQGVTPDKVALIDQAISQVLQDVNKQAANPEVAPPQTIQAIQADRNTDANKGAGVIIASGINLDGFEVAGTEVSAQLDFSGFDATSVEGSVTSALAGVSSTPAATPESTPPSGSGATVHGRSETQTQANTGGDDGAQSAASTAQLFAPRNLETMSREEAKQWLNDRDQAMKQTLDGAATELEQNPALTEIPYCSQTGSDACIQDRAAVVNRKIGHVVKRAILIGVNNYQDKKIPSLVSPLPDVRMVGQLLRDDLGYQTIEIDNPDRDSMIRAFKRMSEESGPDDSVVVYYAGHGYYSEKLDTGYWLPSDAGSNSPAKWLSNRDITRMMRSIGAQQMLLISDSCYSGALVEYQNDPEGMKKVINNKELQTMVLISSGGNEPVSDEGKDGHSVFAYHLAKALKDKKANENSVDLYEKVRKDVYEAFPQSPQYGAARLDKEKPLNREFKLRQEHNQPSRQREKEKP